MRPMKKPEATRILLIALCGLWCVIQIPAATGANALSSAEGPSRTVSATSSKAPSFTWLKPLSDAWRQEYVETYLTGYLFREDVSYCPYGQTEEDLHAQGNRARSEARPPEEGIDCGRRCRMGERNLAAGYLPEALAEYMTAAEKGCPYETDGCRPRVGMLKADLAMGRYSEAKRLFLRISRKHDLRQDRLFILIDGILAALDQHYEQALDRFTRAGTEWHMCANLEGIAGYVLFRQGRFEDARNVFRVAMHSPWTGVQNFGILGLADSTLALGRWAEAEPLYESLVKEGTPLGLLGLAEFRLRQGKLKDARKNLNMLVSSADQDYWKGIALTYLISLTSQPEEWSRSLQLAERAKALVLPAYWANQLRNATVLALQDGIRDLWQSNAHEELLILAEAWRRYQPDLRQDVQLLIGKAYEDAGLQGAALEVYSRLSTDPGALFHGARLAWKCEKFVEAQGLLEKYLATNSEDHRNDARLLLACVHARNHRLDLAKKYLRGIGRVRDPSLLIALGSVEISMGMLDLAIEHLQSALADATISGPERRHLLYVLAELNYQQGRFKEARNCFRLAADGDGDKQRSPTGPMEVLCIARLDNLSSARAELDKLSKDRETDVVAEILDTQDLFQSLRREGHER